MPLPLHPPRRVAPVLPAERRLGWVPYAWLVYLPVFYVVPLVRGASVLEWTATALGSLLFLASYFTGYRGGNRSLAVAAVVQTALGAGFGMVNAGASVFFIYASSFAGQFVPPRVALRAVVGITLLALLVTWLASPPIYYWITTAVFVPLIGAMNYHSAAAERANAGLRMAQAEVEHLAAVAERERIARDLHDVLGHTLSLVVVKAQLAARLAERDPARAAREMRDVESVARAALGEVRETIRGYRASVGDELIQAQALLRAAGVQVDVAREPAALDGIERPREEALALALREAVTNVARHAGARRCAIRVRRDATSSTSCVLEVEDDGHGGDDVEGGGLRGMRERVERLGGTLWRERSAAGGSRLVVTLPVASDVGCGEAVLLAGESAPVPDRS